MQYVDYQFAKDNNIVGIILYKWMKATPNLTTRTKGSVISEWRQGRCLLNIGEKFPYSSVIDCIEQWAKEQADPGCHRKTYMKKYLERNLFGL